MKKALYKQKNGNGGITEAPQAALECRGSAVEHIRVGGLQAVTGLVWTFNRTTVEMMSKEDSFT